MTYFLFCIHNHQPAGNFDFVLEEAYKSSYWPFLKAVSEHPGVKLTLHNSGDLLDWIIEKHPEYIELLRTLVERGQVELLGGGYYEPVLPVIPDADRVGQIRMMGDRLEEIFGVRPRGAWLAERVWEPTLPSTLHDAGVEYLVVDDNHFIKAGLTRDELGGYYITEDRGKMVRIFPGNERLRYLMPFKPVDELEEYLDGLKGFFRKGNAAIYGDDGEKFGVWPGTHKWVFDQGWLEDFLARIESLDRVRSATLGEYVDTELHLGRVYLPTTSYMEMGEWTLPVDASREFSSLVHGLKHKPDGERIKRFLQGGTWRNFFAKYPESNWMHKRMLAVSGEVAEFAASGRDPARAEKARNSLYRGQCNDAYWHGVFGGLYLPHLRTEVYRNLIEAEALVREDGPAARARDIDSDGLEEVEIRSGDLGLFVSPGSGGAVYELDVISSSVNLMNTLTRWPEGYHSRLLEDMEEEAGDGAKSIHDVVLAKEDGLREHLRKDRYRRGSFIDHFIGSDETLDSFKDNSYVELGDFTSAPYRFTLRKDGAAMERTGPVRAGAGSADFRVSKEIRAAGTGAFAVDYRVRDMGGEPPETPLAFGVEVNLMLPCCDGPACYLAVGRKGGAGVPDGGVGLGTAGELAGVEKITLVDSHTGVYASIETDRPATLWRFPIHTVSLSEAGFEKIYQGTCLVFLFTLPADGEEAAFGFRVSAASL